MKRRCVPLKADHNLLTPDTHTLLGVRFRPVIQVRSEAVASLSGHLSDSSNSESTVGSTRRRSAASPTRRLRFEDETETEAECRYLERQRQRRQAGKQALGVLVSKPDLNLYVNSGAGLQGPRHIVDRQHGGGTVGEGQCDSCGTVLEGGVNLNLHLHPTPLVPDNAEQSLYWPHLNLRTEPIKETYIGSVTLTDSSRGGGGAQGVPNMQVRRRTNQVELNGNQALHTTELPINPYADPLVTPTIKHTSVLSLATSRPSSSSPPPVTSAGGSQNTRLNGTTPGQSMNQNQEERGIPAAAKPHKELPSGGDTKKSPCVAPTMKNSSSSETAVESQTPPTSESSSEGHVRQPMTVQLHSDLTALPEQFGSRDKLSRLSLRNLFSSVTLSRTRTSSLDRLTIRPRPTAYDSTPCDSTPCGPTPSDPRKSSSLLSVGSPFLQLRKSSSVQSFVSEQKKKKDRSADYRPADERYLQRSLSVEDVGCPGSLRSVGRLLHVRPDGTFLLELSRPQNQTYGFMISRGSKGVYVEDMVDSSIEKLYAGLLAVGDEILEVNGEKVACLTLDQVTHLLTHNSSTTVRVLRHWKSPQR
ncbi:uncharacterized protein LOC121900014 isoform X2 [Thunnus maccoyii]|uniref:uncharacterized protein LOC121900014 isoform X2 n=1 Tax=Thunnus maccoyii TaxID=8240 RepID=UPI001C4C74F0|nr:uncharacterized protein LOC121900014 isoform X2 [Thunnus maccoyii]